jgi:hypothetical protein
MTNLRREKKVYLTNVGGKYEVFNHDKQQVFGVDDNYFIYFKNVTFKADGTIDGRYLGEATKTLIDGYCRNVTYDNGFKVDGQLVRTARMVAVNSQDGAIIIIN